MLCRYVSCVMCCWYIFIGTLQPHKKKRVREVGDSYVEFREFRMLLVYLHQYFEYLVMFDQIDTRSI